MTYINPLIGTPLAGALAQQHAATEKTREVRRAQIVARNIAAEADRLEHQVENAEELSPIHDEDEHPEQQRRRRKARRRAKDAGATDQAGSDEEPHIDVRA